MPSTSCFSSDRAGTVALSRRRYVRNLMLFGGIALGLGLFLALGGLCWMQGYGLAFPRRTLAGSTPAALGSESWREVHFITSDGLRLDGWFIPSTLAAPAPAILFVHGHGGNRAQFFAELRLLLPEGYAALMFDLRNHGTSEGNVTTMGLLELEDVRAAFAYLVEQPDVDPERIALYGTSMGGATAIRAMARLPQVRVLVVDAAYDSYSRLVSDGVHAVSGLGRFPFGDLIIGFTGLHSGQNLYAIRPIDDIASIAPRPILILHGTADSTVPVSHGRSLFAAAGEPKALYLVEGGGHGGLLRADPQAYARQVVSFLNTHLRDK